MGIDKIGMNMLNMHKHDLKLSDKGGEEKKAAQQFEAYMVQMMIREMRKTVPKGMFSSQSMEIFMDLMDQQVAEQIAENGGMGFSSSLEDAMKQRGTTMDEMMGGHSIEHQIDQLMGRHDHSPTEIPLSLELPLSNILNAESDSHLDLFQQIAPGVPKKTTTVFPLEGRISSRFGHRTDPIHGGHRHHNGLDIAAPKGTDIHAIRSGTVIESGSRGGYGNLVVIDHGNGMQSYYAHCDTLMVQVGQKVDANTVIATVGSTGRSTGPHLHLEIRQNGKAIDPLKILK